MEPHSNVPRFFGRSGEPRYIWHPQAHELFEESCHFLLLAGEFGHGRLVADGLNRLLARLDITPSSINVVFGPYDVVVRLWLTSTARLRLRRALADLPTDKDFRVDNYLEFNADHVQYSSEPLEFREVDQGGFTSHPPKTEERIRAVVRAAADGSWRENELADFDTLVRSNIILQHKVSEGVKFYIFLQAISPGQRPQNTNFVTSDLLRHSALLEDFASSVTVYSGNGFCEYILKGVTREYHEILPFVQKIQQRAEALGLRAWTLAAADSGVRREGETIDAALAYLPTKLNNFIRQSTEPETLGRLVKALKPQQQQGLAEIYGAGLNELNEETGLDRYCELLERVVANDRRLINQTLSFLTSIEGDLRQVLPRYAAKYLPENWTANFLQDVKSVRRGANPNDDTKPTVELLTLSELLEMLRRTADESIDIRRRMDSLLPPSWVRETNDVMKLRNDYSHSRLGPILQKQEFDAESYKLMFRRLCTAIAFQRGLEQLADTLDTAS